jgi:hypothetical protein
MVKRNLARWRQIRCKNLKGDWYLSSLPNAIDVSYKGKLLTMILEMPEKNPISFEDALHIIDQKLTESFEASDFGPKPGQHHWYFRNFVSYISDLGHHIELTGDELEPFVVPEVRT